ncbi:MAG: hypothetical protein Q4Q31_02605 [Bacillota bacterium]|nr:hypothetical protein [Bacillota bacterium]
MFNHIIQELITKSIEKQTEKIITKTTHKKIQQEEAIYNKPHLFVSGYYQAYAFLLVSPILIAVLLLCIFIQLQVYHFDMVALCYILIILLLYITYKRVHKMYLLAYWQSGLTFYDRKGNQLVQIPSSYLKNASLKINKIIIPYHNETWIIEKNKNDNLKAIEQMLLYFKNDSF